MVLVSWLMAQQAAAFCGFYVGGAESSLYNDATMVVLLRSGTTTVLSMQNSYQGPPEGFAMVVPVPQVLQKDNVKTLPREIFAHIDKLSAPRLVEYWENDPCYIPEPMMPMAASPVESDVLAAVDLEGDAVHRASDAVAGVEVRLERLHPERRHAGGGGAGASSVPHPRKLVETMEAIPALRSCRTFPKPIAPGDYPDCDGWRNSPATAAIRCRTDG